MAHLDSLTHRAALSRGDSHGHVAGFPDGIDPAATWLGGRPDAHARGGVEEFSLGDSFTEAPDPQAFSRKTTVYFKSDVYEDLKDARDHIKRLLTLQCIHGERPEDLAGDISLSGIINASLKLMLREFTLRKKDSLLLQQLVRDVTTP